MPFNDILDRHLYIKKTIYHHEILVRGSGFEPSKKKVLLFFQKYQLVRYSVITIKKSTSVSATNPKFHGRLEKAIRANRRTLRGLIKELQVEGVMNLDDLNELPQGYKTKMLHVITHFLDGFFGIDTYFYNLVEDSHWVSEETQSKIVKNPSDFWLLSLEARI
jgi:glycyl-tRNA synthetase (class II)